MVAVSLKKKKEEDRTKGMKSKEIAAELFISAHTVEYHRRQLLKKTNSRNIAQLIGNAFRMGIL